MIDHAVFQPDIQKIIFSKSPTVDFRIFRKLIPFENTSNPVVKAEAVYALCVRHLPSDYASEFP